MLCILDFKPEIVTSGYWDPNIHSPYSDGWTLSNYQINSANEHLEESYEKNIEIIIAKALEKSRGGAEIFSPQI